MDITFKNFPILAVQEIFGPETQHLTSIAYDSRDVEAGAAFFCVSGENTDGHLYIEQALSMGAAAIFGTEREVLESYASDYPNVTFIIVVSTKEALAHLSILYYGNAQNRLFKVGVTGTNGKTTTATFAADLLTLLGQPCGFLGTTGIRSSTAALAIKKSTPTTPMSTDIHHAFAQMAETGDCAAAMEVSSIALDQQRVEGIDFDVAIHTNISEEHLEYHGTFDHYLNAKRRLFDQSKHLIVNLDDEKLGLRILEGARVPVLTYSHKEDSGADLIWTDLELTGSGTSFVLVAGGMRYMLEVPLFGEYNIGNLTAAIGAALIAGHSLQQIIEVLPRMSQVEGRFQLLQGPEERKIVLDYAHTPVAIDAVLQQVKKLPHRRLIALIAGIGIRDFGKMPKMAKAAEGKADVLVVTVDHPGNHQPEVIVEEVMKGFSFPYQQRIIKAMTRKEAVEAALAESEPGDLVLLSSGCINGAQIIKGEYIPHSDEAIIEGFFLAKS